MSGFGGKHGGVNAELAQRHVVFLFLGHAEEQILIGMEGLEGLQKALQAAQAELKADTAEVEKEKAHAKSLTAEDEKVFEGLWKHLGLSVDWSKTYATISKTAQRVSQLCRVSSPAGHDRSALRALGREHRTQPRRCAVLGQVDPDELARLRVFDRRRQVDARAHGYLGGAALAGSKMVVDVIAHDPPHEGLDLGAVARLAATGRDHESHENVVRDLAGGLPIAETRPDHALHTLPEAATKQFLLLGATH